MGNDEKLAPSELDQLKEDLSGLTANARHQVGKLTLSLEGLAELLARNPNTIVKRSATLGRLALNQTFEVIEHRPALKLLATTCAEQLAPSEGAMPQARSCLLKTEKFGEIGLSSWLNSETSGFNIEWQDPEKVETVLNQNETGSLQLYNRAQHQIQLNNHLYAQEIITRQKLVYNERTAQEETLPFLERSYETLSAMRALQLTLALRSGEVVERA